MASWILCSFRKMSRVSFSSVLIKETGKGNFSSLLDGNAPPLFLIDFWVLVIFICSVYYIIRDFKGLSCLAEFSNSHFSMTITKYNMTCGQEQGFFIYFELFQDIL